MWNGAADILKPSPATMSAIPVTRSESPLSPCVPIEAAMPWNEIVPVAPMDAGADPKRKSPSQTKPTIKELFRSLERALRVP